MALSGWTIEFFFLSLFYLFLHLGLKTPLFTTKQDEKLITITSNYPNYMQEIRMKKRKGKEKLGYLPVSALLTSLA